jgi:hypothetical protein
MLLLLLHLVSHVVAVGSRSTLPHASHRRDVLREN